ncbi:MAG: cytochrome d ubiquinol oxidase subunit II [Caryophanon sp.]|nr:cytochrome d ubiquinol oxidase subunit II [Caryophanon sp.]
MFLEVLGITVLWIFLFGYVIVASIDFGAGFFNAYSLVTNQNHVLSGIIKRYLSPVWEITNVFFVFFFVGIVGFFPQTAYYYGTVLLVPASIALILLTLRGSYYAFESYSGVTGHKGYALMYGLAGLFIPASLSVVLTISEGGFVQLTEVGPQLDYDALFTSPLTWAIVVLSITAVLYISAVFLTWYAHYAGDQKASMLMRKYALVMSLPLIVSAIGIIVEMRRTGNGHYENMVDLSWLFIVSGILFLATTALLWMKEKYGFAVLLMILQFATAFFAYGISHYPYLLYPYLTVHDSFTTTSMAIAIVIAFIAGLCLLIPSMYLVLKLFIFNKSYASGDKETHV